MPISSASQPLYHRVYRRIAQEIESGSLGPGDRLPSERWLCDELGVSRATVRRAIEELAADGLVEARGRGSFVTSEALAEPPNTLVSLTDLGRSRGLEASSRVLLAEARASTIDEAATLGIAPGAELFELERLRMLDGVPISHDRNRVPLRYLPGALDIDFTHASLYAALDASGHAPVRADYEVEADVAAGAAAELLGLAAGAPVLRTTTLAHDEAGRAIDVGTTLYRADRYRFQATLMRRTQSEREREHGETLGSGGRGGRGHGRHRGVRRDAG